MFQRIILETICTWLLASELALLQVHWKKYQKALKWTYLLSYTLHYRPNPDKSRHGPLKCFIKHTDITFELLAQNEKRNQNHQIQSIPYYPKEILHFFSHAIIRWRKCGNPVTTHDSDSSDIIQKDLYTSYDSYELDDNVFMMIHSVMNMMTH